MKDPLQALPGIGPSLALDLRELGFAEPADLLGQDPEDMYRELIRLRGVHQDRCVLYAFRCAVHCSGPDGDRDPELRKWWNWTDRVEA